MSLALVTGGARRIGRAVCQRLAADGHEVVVHHRTSHRAASELVQELKAIGVEAWSVSADLAGPDEAQGLVQEAGDAAGGPVEILVNNASAFPRSRFEEMAYGDLEEMVRLHAWAPHTLARALAAQEVEGCVVNLLDTRVTDYDWQHVPYHLSKRMLWDLTRLAAVRLAPRVRVNAVAPGPILAPAGTDDAAFEKLAESVPLRRTGQPEEVADAVAWLVGARYTTGQVLWVDGGRHLERTERPW